MAITGVVASLAADSPGAAMADAGSHAAASAVVSTAEADSMVAADFMVVEVASTAVEAGTGKHV
jgi:hypothetical protein